MTALVCVDGVSVDYGGGRHWRNVLRELSLTLGRGEVVGLAGESGCGKSTLASLLLGERRADRRIAGGRVLFDGLDLFAAPARLLRRLQGARVALVPQNGGAALTPTMRIGSLFAETLRRHRPGLSKRQIAARTVEVLDQVGVPQPDGARTRYPHQFSGGQQQRIALALAMVCEPDLLVLDEPTTGQDAVIRRDLVSLLRRLAAGRRTAMLYVSHDLATLGEVCDRIAVMYAGEIVEDGPAADVLERPAHPYAAALVAALPRLDRPPGPAPDVLPLDRLRLPPGCRFAPRCPQARADCAASRQHLAPYGAQGRRVACRYAPAIAAEGAARPPAASRIPAE